LESGFRPDVAFRPGDTVGVGHILTATVSGVPPWQYFVLRSYAVCAVGVGHKPDAFAEVGRTDVGSGYNVPFRIIPDLGQRPANLFNSGMKEVCDVFHDRESGS
jgi:hypothetical protein